MRFNKFLQLSTGLLLLSGLTVGCTFAPASYQQNVQSSIGRGNVYADVRDDGTVVLTGWTEDYYSRQRAESVARQGEGITDVINLIHVAF